MNQAYETLLNQVETMGGRKLSEFEDIKSLAAALREYSSAEQALRYKKSEMDRLSAARVNRMPHTAPRITGRTKPERKITEIGVGKYALTVLASVLILGAVCVFLALLWPSIPDFVKYVLLLAIGVGLELLGAQRARNFSMRPFWLGVSGLGSAILFLDVTAGGMLFGLYGGLLSVILVLAWCGVAFYLGRMAGSGAGLAMYEIIAYIGACIAVLMAGAAYGGGAEISWICFGLSACVGVMGYLDYIRSEKPVRCWILAAYLCIAGACVYFQYDDMYNTAAGLCAGILCAVALAVSSRSKLDSDVLIQLLAYTFQAGLMLDYFDGWAGAGYGHAFGLLVMCVLCIGGNGWYHMGISASAFIAVGHISSAMSESFGMSCWPYLFGPGLAVSAVGFALSMGSKRSRAGAAAFWLACAIGACSAYYPNVIYGAVLLAILACPMAMYWRACNYDGSWFSEPWDKLALYILPALCVSPLTRSLSRLWSDGFQPDPVPFIIALAGLYLYFNNEMAGRDTSFRIECVWRAGRAAAFGLMCSCGFIAGSFGESEFIPTLIVTAGIVMSLAFNVYLLGLSIGTGAGIWACGLANLCLGLLFSLWDLNTGAVLSVAGILLAAGCLWLGFSFQLKRLRLGGLAGAVLWSVKLGLFDIANGTAMGAAGGLLLAGLICLGMSLAYNKLGRMLESGGEDRDP